MTRTVTFDAAPQLQIYNIYTDILNDHCVEVSFRVLQNCDGASLVSEQEQTSNGKCLAKIWRPKSHSNNKMRQRNSC